MNMNEYQKIATSTAIYPKQGTFTGLMYCGLKLAGEAGEVADKIGKIFRDDKAKLTQANKQKLFYELGDALWYIANIAKELGYELESVAVGNIDKVRRRKEEGTLHGSGDNR